MVRTFPEPFGPVASVRYSAIGYAPPRLPADSFTGYDGIGFDPMPLAGYRLTLPYPLIHPPLHRQGAIGGFF